MKRSRIYFRILILSLLLISLLPHDSQSSPYVGGEIQWECLPNGNLRFKVIAYRECAWWHTGHNSLHIYTSFLGGIELYLADREDISPSCHPDTSFDHLNCSLINIGIPYINKGSVERLVYTSDSLFPNGIQVNGVPPSSGWTITALDSYCCRHPATNLFDPQSYEILLRAVMRPYGNKPYFPCFDSSPTYAAPPQTAICAGYETSLSQYTYDPDRDELSYSWAQPLYDYSQSIPFVAPYSFDHPLPGPSQHPDNKVSMDPKNGLITVECHNPGTYVYTQKITAKRDGIIISENYRDFQIVVDSCDSINKAPQVFHNYQPLTPDIQVIDTTVSVGENLFIEFQTWDTVPHTLSNGSLQTVEINAQGEQFGTNYTSPTSGCQTPPCATLNHSLPVYDSMPQSIQLNWPVTIDHFIALNKNSIGSDGTVDFAFQFTDDYCPLPMTRNLRFQVKVNLDSLIGLPGNHCFTYDTSGAVMMEWDSLLDPNQLFTSYKIYSAFSVNGPYTLIDSISNSSITNYTHQAGNMQKRYYRLVADFEMPNGTEFSVKIFEDRVIGYNLLNPPCEGEAFLIIPNIYAQIDSIAYEFNQGQLIAQSNDSLWFIVDSSGPWSLKTIEYTPCGTNTSSFNIQIREAPVPQLTGQSYACPGLPVILTAAPASTYLWSSGSTNQSVVYPPQTGTFHVMLEVSGQNQCKASRIFEIRMVEPFEDESICMINVNPTDGRPEVIWERTEGVDIKGYNVEYANNHSPGNWSTLGQTSFYNPGLLTDPLNDPSSTQLIYRIQVIDSCDNTSDWSVPAYQLHLIATRNGNDIYVSWLPPQNITYNSVYVLRQENGGPFVLLDSVLAPANGYLDISPPSGNLAYRAEIRDQNCEAAAGNVLDVLYSNTAQPVNPGIDENQYYNGLRIFTDQGDGLWLSWDKTNQMSGKVTLFDILGKEVLNTELTKGVDKQYIQLTDLNSGIYIVRVNAENKIMRVKRIIIP